ncbi:MAG: trypsin-like peptidase domain-containing protein [Bdellovibrionales bacterium]|nr:trypsin-like peptidase domain-containing protein [Bdellovibrionales bacterium]
MISFWLQKLRPSSAFICFLALALSTQALGRLLTDEQNNVDVYKNCNPAVVNITTVTLKQDFFFQVYPERGVGSGVVVSPDGYVATNDHVLGQAQKIAVVLHDKSEYPAKVVGRDPDTDLALIKIEAKGKKFKSLDFAAGPLQVGQKVLAIGNPFGLGGSLSVGIVSSLEREIKAQTGRTIKNVIQTDAAINPGNSGGPLLNSSGEIIGINSQIFSTSGGSVGVGFAISGDTAKKIVRQLMQFGQVLRPWLGVEGVGFSAALLNNFQIPSRYGVMVTEVYRGSPAAGADIQPATREFIWGMRVIPVGGDLIYQIDNRPVQTLADIRDYVLDKKAGETIAIHFIRNKRKMKATVKLQYPPGVTAGSF